MSNLTKGRILNSNVDLLSFYGVINKNSVYMPRGQTDNTYSCGQSFSNQKAIDVFLRGCTVVIQLRRILHCTLELITVTGGLIVGEVTIKGSNTTTIAYCVQGG